MSPTAVPPDTTRNARQTDVPAAQARPRRKRMLTNRSQIQGNKYKAGRNSAASKVSGGIRRRRPAALKAERDPVVRRVPPEHRTECEASHDHRQIRTRPPQPAPRGGLHDDVKQHPRWQKDRVIFAQQAPPHARPTCVQAQSDRPARFLRDGHGEPIQRQEPEKEQAVRRARRTRRRRRCNRRPRSMRTPPRRPRCSEEARRQPRHQPRRTGEERDEAKPQRERRDDAPRRRDPQRLNDGQHRWMVEIAPSRDGP